MLHQFADHMAQAVDLLLPRDVAAGTAGELDVLLPAHHLPDRLRLGRRLVTDVDREVQRVVAREARWKAAAHHRRRVGDRLAHAQPAQRSGQRCGPFDVAPEHTQEINAPLRVQYDLPRLACNGGRKRRSGCARAPARDQRMSRGDVDNTAEPLLLHRRQGEPRRVKRNDPSSLRDVQRARSMPTALRAETC